MASEKTKHEGQQAHEDPADRYPKPPFPRKSQDVPGTESAMDPQADHGEQSYRGKNRLAGRAAIITGGDSGIGYGWAHYHIDFCVLAEKSTCMKTLRLLFASGVLIGVASCGNPRENHDDKDASDSLYVDSIANDSATWGDTLNATDTAITTDSLASPSFP